MITLLTTKQIEEAKETLKEMHRLLDKIQYLEQIEDHDGHTDGLAYEAHEEWYGVSDHLYGLDSVLKSIEKFNA